MTGLNELERRVAELESRVAAFDTMIRFGRWVAPILVGIAGIVVGRLT